MVAFILMVLINFSELNMEFYQLRSFVMVAETSNLTKASAKLFTSQPSVSAHIKALEEEFDVELFKRTAKGMHLTTKGKIILEEVQKVFNALNNVENIVASFKKDVVGDLKLGLNTDPIMIRIKELVGSLQEKHPKLKLHLKNASTSEIIELLKRQELDAGFLLGGKEDALLTKWQIHSMQLSVVAPYRFAEQIRNATKNELRKLPWLKLPENSPLKNVLNQLFDHQPVNFIETETTTIDDENTFNTLVGSSSGLCLLREDLAIPAAAKKEIAIWDLEKVALPLYFACLKSQEEQANINAVTTIIHQIWHYPTN